MTSYFKTEEGAEIMRIMNTYPDWDKNKDLVEEVQRLQVRHSIKTRGVTNVKLPKKKTKCVRATLKDGTVLIFHTAKDCAEHLGYAATTIAKHARKGEIITIGPLEGMKFERVFR